MSVTARTDQSRSGSGDEAHGDGPATTATAPCTQDRLISNLLTLHQSCGIGGGGARGRVFPSARRTDNRRGAATELLM